MSRSPRRRSRASAAPAWLFVAAGAAAIGSYASGPPALLAPLYLVVVLGSILAMVVGIRRHQPPGARGPWWALVGAVVCFFGGGIVRLAVPGADGATGLVTLLPDLLVVPGYLLLASGFLALLRRRRAADDDQARADALLVGLGAALAGWVLLIEPYLDAGRTGDVPAVDVAAAFFPVVDVFLLVLVVQLLMADGVRKPALWLVGSATVAMFAGDLLYAARALGVTLPDLPMRVLDVFFLSAHVCLAAAALHPSMRTLTQAQAVVIRRFGIARVVGIAAVLATPTVLASLWPPANGWHAAVRLTVSILLTVTIVARIVRSNNSRARAEDAERRRATHDALTDLPNRELLAETIHTWCDRATGDGQQISLLFLDLDRFKMVNDSWGHDVGDELLCAVAGRLSTMVRGEDLVCRIGGDEFVIALASTSPSRLAESLARRVLAEFAVPFELSVGAVVITPSIGVASAIGAVEALELIRDADTAMYKAKGSGRNGYAFFDRSLRDQARTRVDLEQALRGALEHGELSVHYQPIVELATGELSGFEALMRWTHPQLGAVSPIDFIPIAEDTGLIVDSGAWLLREATGQMARWLAERPDGQPPLHISVNISVRQLRDGALVDVVRDALRRSGLPASSLWLEITESGVIEDLEGSLVTLHQLRDLGVTLCIDDFGTGYSSLTYLRRFPSAIVKVDRSFVAGLGENPDDEAIVRTVVAMAHALGQRVVAEGVETAVQRDWLRSLGCDLGQGWLYGRPGPAVSQAPWLAEAGVVAAGGVRADRG